MLINHEEKWIFLHVPKAAGMYIENALGYEHQSNYHFVTDDLAYYPDYFRFMFVRHPVSRFVSNFKYAVKMSQAAPPEGDRIDRQFIRKVGPDINRFAKVFSQNVQTFFKITHYAPQYILAQQFRPHFIGYFEQLHEDLTVLMRLLGREYLRGDPINYVSGTSGEEDLDPAWRQEIVRAYRLDAFRLGYLHELKQVG